MSNQIAKKNYSHQYPVDNDFWSAFDPNRISGSTSTCGLLHVLTTPLKQIRSFGWWNIRFGKYGQKSLGPNFGQLGHPPISKYQFCKGSFFGFSLFVSSLLLFPGVDVGTRFSAFLPANCGADPSIAVVPRLLAVAVVLPPHRAKRTLLAPAFFAWRHFLPS